jgi:hypothetical protein
MRALVLAVVLLAGCWHRGTRIEGSSASRGTGNELVLPPELGEAARLRRLILRKPVIGRIDSGPTPIVVRGHVSGREARHLVALARLVHDDVTTRFVRPREHAHAPVDLVLYEDDEEFQAIALGYARVPAGQGFYRPDARVAAVNLSRGVGNLRHELVHPIIVDDFPQIPAWLNEGIASMYGGAEVSRGRLRFLVDYRVHDLHAAIDERTLPGRRRLALAGRTELYGADGGIYYAVSQHVVLYLQRSGKLERYYKRVRAHPQGRGDALAAAMSWRRFVVWARRLREGHYPPPP